MIQPRIPGVRLPIEPIAAALLGASVVFFVLAMPVALIERAVVAAGLPAIVGAAQPPLGLTARLLLALLAGGGVAATAWYGLSLFDRPARRRRARPVAEQPAMPAFRRADTHPDAPARRPLSAGFDLGEPLELVDPVIDDVPAPADLAPPPSWTRDAGPLVAKAPPEAGAPSLAAPPAPGGDAASLLGLIDRLEAGLARRGAAADRPANVTPLPRGPKPLDVTLRDALAELRQMAARRG